MNKGQIHEEYPYYQPLALDVAQVPWCANIMNYLVSVLFPPSASIHQKQRLRYDARFYMWDEPYLFKKGPYQMMRRFIVEQEASQVLQSCHTSSYGGHHGVKEQHIRY